MHDALIVKFGGSSIPPLDLARWVEAVEESTRPTVLVPGGGPFAGAVRRLQGQVGYDDAVAREMTVLAMEQFGRALCSLGSRLAPCDNEASVVTATTRGQIAIWMPAQAALRGGAASWYDATTSDCVAARLAAWFPNSTLCLIKRIDLPEGCGLHAVTAAGVVDPAFEAMLHPATRLYVAGPADLRLAAQRLARGHVPGREVVRDDEYDTMREAAQ